MKKIKNTALCVLILCLTAPIFAQSSGYQTPPKPLADLVNVSPTPSVSVDSKGEMMLLTERSDLPSIADLAQPELKIAGLRLNPATNGGSRQTFVINMKVRKLTDKGDGTPVKGLPNQPKLSFMNWSPDETKVAFTHTTASKIELYVLDVATATAKKISDLAINGSLGQPFSWLSDSKTLLVKTIPTNRGNAPEVSRVPTGPNTQENLGKKAQAPTYQDLLKNATDEALFEHYATSQIVKMDLNGKTENIGSAGIIANMTTSPDGKYALMTTVHRPFSYLVTLFSFPTRYDIFDLKGNLVKTLVDNPLEENRPSERDGTTPNPRGFSWRNDQAATVYWTEAQDGGDAKKKNVPIRDRVFALEAPFSGDKKEIYAAALRFGGFTWGNDKLALATERWWNTRKVVVKMFDPSTPSVSPTVLEDRSFEDRYNDPGEPELKRNKYGRFVLDVTKNNEIYLTGSGASPEGDRPFVDVLNLTTRQTKRLWRSEAPVFEQVVSVLDAEKGLILTTRETQTENPNYFIRNLNAQGKTPQQITFFPHPYPQLKGVTKQLLKYKRADGVDLTATLYLPAGYDQKKQGALPTFFWAYPAEFKSKEAAGQVDGSPLAFNRISYWGAAPFVTMGYAVLDDVSIPIVGEGDKEPNDTYVEQLVASAKAAIDEGVKMGVVDSSRVGVGGHSYGAFMTANLLTHSKLFKAGIARSGAYNRTLTPYGFQAEQRTYWQAPEVYNTMSPFMNADKMKTPLLLVHGEADNNQGTFPIQTERYYNALKGMGATTKMVLLPYESHGYQAKESLLHMLWEMNGWLEKYVKKPLP